MTNPLETPNFWAMPRAELVRSVELLRKIEAADKVIQRNNEELLHLKDQYIANLKKELENAPKTAVETALIRLARHSPAPNMVQSIYRVIELAVFHSDVDIDSTEKENFLPLLEIIGVFKEDSCYSLS